MDLKVPFGKYRLNMSVFFFKSRPWWVEFFSFKISFHHIFRKTPKSYRTGYMEIVVLAIHFSFVVTVYSKNTDIKFIGELEDEEYI